jgi:dimethylglycine dehydrogenase
MAVPLWPTDAAADISAIESGFAPLIDLEKPAFPGRAAVLAERDRKAKRRLVALLLEADGLCPMGEEGVYSDEALVGRMTSAGWSFHFGRPVGLAIVDAAYTETGTKLRVPVLDSWLDAIVIVQGPYDPARQRARAS